MELIVKSLKSG